MLIEELRLFKVHHSEASRVSLARKTTATSAGPYLRTRDMMGKHQPLFMYSLHLVYVDIGPLMLACALSKLNNQIW